MCVSTLLCLLLNVFMILDKVVSSAYIIKSTFLEDSEKSFICMINNNKGPIIEPCGTPILKVIFQIFNFQFQNIVSCFLSNFQIVSELNLPVRNILASTTVYKAAASLCLSVCLYPPPLFRHDRRTAKKFGTHIRIDTGLALT